MPDHGDFQDLLNQANLNERLGKEKVAKEEMVKGNYAKLITEDPKYNIFLSEIQEKFDQMITHKNTLARELVDSVSLTVEQIVDLKTKITYVNAWLDCMNSVLSCVDNIIIKGDESKKELDTLKYTAALSGAVPQ